MTPVKILRGKQSQLPDSLEDGCMYICTDTMNMYIDFMNDSGDLERGQLNAKNSLTCNGLNFVVRNDIPISESDTTISFVRNS